MQDVLSDQEKTALVFGIHDEVLEPWTITKADGIAQAEGITLTDAHLDVIQYLRATYKKHGPIKHARTLTQALEAKYATSGGSKYLYTLFPRGPVAQGCRLAGIPLPTDSRNTSFGTSF